MEWQYQKIILGDHHRRRDDIDLLCELGEDGWELVAITSNNVAYLKRKIEDEPAAVATDHQHQHEPAVGPKPKYRDPRTDETWSGRGRMATWLKRKQDAGEDIEKYRVE